MTIFENTSTPTLLFADTLESSFVFEVMQNAHISVIGIPGCNVAQYPEQKVHNAISKILLKESAQIMLMISVHSKHLQSVSNGQYWYEAMTSDLANKMEKGLASGTDSLLWLLAVKAYMAERLENLKSWPAIRNSEQNGRIAVRGFVVNEQKNVIIEVMASGNHEETGYVNSLKRLKNERL